MMPLTLVSRFHHPIAAAGSPAKKEKKKKGHTRKPSLPPVGWRGGPELDYGLPSGVPRVYDPNSPDFGAVLPGIPAYQPGADYRYPAAISDADFDVGADANDQHTYQDQSYGQGQGR